MKEYKYECKYCKRIIYQKYKKRSKHNKFYCSNQCRANDIKNTHNIICQNCGKLYYANWSRRECSDKSFCTKSCYWEYKKKLVMVPILNR